MSNMKQKPGQKYIILLLSLALLFTSFNNVIASQLLMVSGDCASYYATDDNQIIPDQQEQRSVDKNCEHKQACGGDCTDCTQCTPLITISMEIKTQQEQNRLQASSITDTLFKNPLLPRELKPPRHPV
ncbi:MAG TPA: hypothetical protein ENI65_07570 [Gammaproteobacteria bacterium]|nr:hypothetical protein [Gammaproteobacteria bacterium]